MKLIYITAKRYPSNKVDPFFVRSMASAFNSLLDSNFLFIVRGKPSKVLDGINTKYLNFPNRFRTIFYFFWLLIYVQGEKINNSETVFFSYDPYLLAILIFWRKVFSCRYFVCSDWHQLFDDWRDTYVSKNCDLLTCTSERLKGLLVSKCKVGAEKILVAYGSVDPVPFFEKQNLSRDKLRENLRLPKDKFLVGYVGGFTSVGLKKGLDTMINSLKFLDTKIYMVFVGGSAEAISDYQSLADSCEVGERVIFVRKQSFDLVVQYEIAMDVLVIPYPDSHHFRDYGFPLKTWEYLASGRPIVYSNLEIMSEVLGSKATSFVPDNEKSLAESIHSVFNNYEAKLKMAMINAKDIEKYSWHSRAKNIVNFLGKLNTENN